MFLSKSLIVHVGRAIFTPPGYIHWGYSVPHGDDHFAFALAWNTFPAYALRL